MVGSLAEAATHDPPPGRGLPLRPRPRSLEVRGLDQEFTTSGGRSVTALRDVSVRVDAGKFCSIVGPSGCGKSTLLSALAGLLVPTRGTVTVDGELITRPYPNLGMVFQRDLLLEWRDVLDNVLLQIELLGLRRRQYLDYAQELLAMVGVSDFAHHYPRQLSGGMRQRVALCRALVHSPNILLMDEPFGALDALNREKLNIDVDRLCTALGITTVLITHSIDEAVFLADEVVALSDRPGHVIGRWAVPMERPRSLGSKDSPEFVKLVSNVRSTLHKEGVL